MPNFGMFPQQETIFSGTITATGTQALTQALPPASSYRIICQVNTVSGTSPTLVMAICTSFDAGTTYNSVVSTSTMSTTGQGQQLLIRPYLGIGDAATNAATALVGVATLAAAIVNNGPINPQQIQLQFVAGGTSPSFAVKVGVIAVPQDMSD
jgi:hypothetical protein